VPTLTPDDGVKVERKWESRSGADAYVRVAALLGAIAKVAPTLLRLLAALACVQLLIPFVRQAVLLIPAIFLGK